MRGAAAASWATALAVAMAISVTQPRAHTTGAAVSAEEITRAFRGKVCTTTMGATFTFGADGRYSYDGLWMTAGRYLIRDGAITVTLDNGLERSFAISQHGNLLHIEDTVLYCRSPEPLPS